MKKRTLIFSACGLLALGVVAIAAVYLRDLARERQAMRHNNLGVALYSDAYEKGLEHHSAHTGTVEPLPFHGMASYPYEVGAYPLSEEHLEYLFRWNTRSSLGGR